MSNPFEVDARQLMDSVRQDIRTIQKDMVASAQLGADEPSAAFYNGYYEAVLDLLENAPVIHK